MPDDDGHIMSIRLPVALYEELRLQAFEERRSMVEIIRVALEEHFRQTEPR